MRSFAGLVLSATCLLWSGNSYAQDNYCSARAVSSNPTEKPLTLAEVAHRAMVGTPPTERRNLYWGDVELILRCGLQQDATELFAVVRNGYVQMNGAKVVEADQTFVRISWNDGFNSGGFRFNFDRPLTSIPKPGEKVIISGAYSSYSREPFQINLADSSLVSLSPQP